MSLPLSWRATAVSEGLQSLRMTNVRRNRYQYFDRARRMKKFRNQNERCNNKNMRFILTTFISTSRLSYCFSYSPLDSMSFSSELDICMFFVFILWTLLTFTYIPIPIYLLYWWQQKEEESGGRNQAKRNKRSEIVYRHLEESLKFECKCDSYSFLSFCCLFMKLIRMFSGCWSYGVWDGWEPCGGNMPL